MTIIHIVLGKANPDRMNGVSKVAHYLATFQARTGLKTAIWGITSSPEVVPQDREYAIRLFQNGNTAFGMHATLEAAISQLPTEGTIVHLHGGFIPAFYRISQQLRKQGIRYVFSPHGSLSPFALKRGLKKRLYFHMLEKRMLKGAEAVHFLGEWQAEAFDQFMHLPKKVVIPNGQDLMDLDLPTKSTQERQSGPVFSFCGRLIIHYKGLDLLMEAFSQYRKQGGTGVLWLIGDGEDRKRLEEQADALQLHDSVVFWGSRFGAEKLNLLKASDCFVHPSRSEGLPTSVLEAAGLGLPCIVSKPTNMDKALTAVDAGIGLPDLAPATISQALSDMEAHFEKGRLPRMGARAIQMIRSAYNWDRIAQDMVQHLYGHDHAA